MKTENGKGTFIARQVIDARGWQIEDFAKVGYQKFFGQSLRLNNPHGLQGPVIMDATVKQDGAYRFIYLLPWSEKELLVEDTYYANTPDLDKIKLSAQIKDYCTAQNWQIEKVLHEEAGVLPLPMKQEKNLHSANGSALALGARSGLCQPVTGYTFPLTVQTIERWLQSPLENWTAIDQQIHRQMRWPLAVLHYLNRMLFLVAEPEKRFVILQRFYRLPEPLIQRFYSGDLRGKDFVRILIGKPPVSIIGALRVLKP